MDEEKDKEYISVKKAKSELGDSAYFAFHRWLVSKGHRNLNDNFVTRTQLKEFIKEVAKGQTQPDESTDNLWGQTKEVWSGYKPLLKSKLK